MRRAVESVGCGDGFCLYFLSSRRRHTRYGRDWSSDVCSSDLIVPSAFARERLRALGAPLPWERVHVLPPPVRSFSDRPGSPSGSYALVASRLAPEKGVDVAIAACRLAGLPLVVAGDGPELESLRELAGDCDVRFAGRVDAAELDRLRAGASIALVPSRSAETFGMAAA